MKMSITDRIEELDAHLMEAAGEGDQMLLFCLRGELGLSHLISLIHCSLFQWWVGVHPVGTA